MATRDITTILDELHIPYKRSGEHQHVGRDFVGIDCPFCGEEGKFHLGINLTKGYATCWRCGYHSLYDVIFQITGDRGLSRELSRKARDLPQDTKNAHRRESVRFSVPRGVGPLLPAHRRYLASRRLDPDYVARVWGVKAIGNAARLAWRLFIPIIHKGEPVSWTTRAIGKRRPRYISAPADQELIPAKHLLYGEDYCRMSVVVVEGPVDVWRVGPGAVATLGISVTQEQVLRLARFCVRAICFDSSPDAQNAAERLASDLAVFGGRTDVVQLETGEDPGDADEEELAELRKVYL